MRSRTRFDPVSKAKAGHQGPGHHLHLEDGKGSELTIGVLDPE
jgi:hypothetical protein